jgi:hypothetical protein
MDRVATSQQRFEDYFIGADLLQIEPGSSNELIGPQSTSFRGYRRYWNGTPSSRHNRQSLNAAATAREAEFERLFYPAIDADSK